MHASTSFLQVQSDSAFLGALNAQLLLSALEFFACCGWDAFGNPLGTCSGTIRGATIHREQEPMVNASSFIPLGYMDLRSISFSFFGSLMGLCILFPLAVVKYKCTHVFGLIHYLYFSLYLTPQLSSLHQSPFLRGCL